MDPERQPQPQGRGAEGRREKVVLQAAEWGLTEFLFGQDDDGGGDNNNNGNHNLATRARDPHTGKYALHVAARKGHAFVCQRLLLPQETKNNISSNINSDADVNARDYMKQTPLHLAVRHGRYEVVELLLRHGADPNALDLRRLIPLDGLDRKTTTTTTTNCQSIGTTTATNSRNHKMDSATKKKIRAKLAEYNSFPRKRFFEVLFGAPKVTDGVAWLERMMLSISNVFECKIFYTAAAAALDVGLLSIEQMDEMVSEALIQSMRCCCTTLHAREVLLAITSHAVNDETIAPTLANLIRNFLDKSITNVFSSESKEKQPANLRDAVEEGCKFVNGIDGTIATTRTCLAFYRQACFALRYPRNPGISVDWEQQSPNNSDDTFMVQKRAECLMGIMGAVVNAMVFRNSNSGEFIEWSRACVNFLDTDHMARIVNQREMSSLAVAMERARQLGQTFIARRSRRLREEELESQGQILGVCTGALDGFPFYGDDGTSFSAAMSRSESRVTTSSKSSLVSVRSSSTQASLIFRDAILSESDAKRLALHMSIKLHDREGLQKALQVKSLDLNARDTEGRSALDLAALTGQTDLFKMLCDQGAQPAKLPLEALKVMLQVRALHVNDYYSMMSVAYSGNYM